MNARIPLSPAFVALVVLGLAFPTGSAAAGELAVEGQASYFSMVASKSANAVFDSSAGFTWGGAARYSIDLGVYVTAGVRTFSKDGERVFLAGPGGSVARLGHPLSVRIMPIFATVGYRYRQGELIVPYAGIGGSLASYREESTVAGLAYDESRSKMGFHVVGGAEIGRGRLRFGAEVGWSTVADAVGIGGVSEVYGENNLGGWTVLGKVVFAFGTGRKVPEELGPIK